ncbi:MAG: RIP metalloprotease RseP [Lachnospiraceae bacterium]|nr:RIP metalloprotease RseP [Lachnospiraceae bacterium]
MTVILFILIFGVVVLSHEFGHFLLAKMNGIHVVEFAIGMGPTLFSFTKKETKYAIKLLPIGGACMFEGEDGLETENGGGEGSFLKAGVWARIATVVAGPLFNFILAFIVAVIVVSMSVTDLTVLSGVSEGGPAEEAGLMEGDRIISLNGEKTCLFRDVYLITLLNKGTPIKVVYERDGERLETELVPVYSEADEKYVMGVYGGVYEKPEGLAVFRDAWYEIRYSVRATYKSLGLLLTGQFSRKDVAGPVGIAVNVVGKTYEETKQYGVQTVVLNMLNIIMLLSVNLGILNLLPIPALDGGRLVFLLLEVIRKKPVPPEKEGIVHFVGLVFFMVLMVVVLFNDLVNIFGA